MSVSVSSTLFNIGQKITLRVEIFVTDPNASPSDEAVLTDPTTLVFTLREPDDTLTVRDFSESPGVIDNPSTGIYSTDFIVSQSGLHYYRWESTGTAHAAEDRSFKVEKSPTLGS